MKLNDIVRTIQIQRDHMNQKKVVSGRYSGIRFILLVMGVICLYYGYQKAFFFYYLFVMDIVIFLWFAKIHRDVLADIEMLQLTIDSYEDIIARKKDTWKNFEDDGSAYLQQDTTQAYDLDIFGHASLFQYLVCAKTILGRDKLATTLNCQLQTKEEIELQQSAVQEMAQKEAFNIRFTGLLKQFAQHGRKKKKTSMEAFFTYMEQDAPTYPRFFHLTIMLLSICTLIATIYAIFGQGSIAYMSIFGVISICVAMLSVIKNAQAFHDVSIMENTLCDYRKMFEHITKENFQSQKLKEQCSYLEEAGKALRKLNLIVNMIRLRNDGITFLIFNFFLLLDFECVFALEAWKKTYGKQIRVWYEALAYFEMVLSLSQLNYAKEGVCFPSVLTQDTPRVASKAMYNPLLCEETAITNDFQASNETYIITGSNMSGKTTFLRTLGLNLVLLQAGAMVCAESFAASRMDIYTSMRIKDDVSEGISTFYAEILRVKEMIVKSHEKKPMIVFIDEIFKGTNSADRIICAKEVLRQLHLPHVITLVSTHDFELCELSFTNTTKAINYHFSEFYEHNKIDFDYTLKDGICTTTNAKELLYMAGISIDTIQ